MKKRTFSPEFKRETASLVVDKGYTTQEASEAVDVSLSATGKWVKQLKGEREGCTPANTKALTP